MLVGDDGTVRTLTLNRPARLNAFTAASYQSLATLLVEADGDEKVHAVVLRGAGRAFSSGVDLDALRAHPDAPTELGQRFDELLDVLMTLRIPLLAAVTGPAVGFGATILLHCDLVLVADDARLRFPFTSLHTAPEAGSSMLLAAFGRPAAGGRLPLHVPLGRCRRGSGRRPRPALLCTRPPGLRRPRAGSGGGGTTAGRRGGGQATPPGSQGRRARGGPGRRAARSPAPDRVARTDGSPTARPLLRAPHP